MRQWGRVGGLVLVAVLSVGCVAQVDDPPDRDRRDRADRDERHRQDKSRDDGTSSASRTTNGEQGSEPAAPTYLVVHVVDGDTVDLGNGETVRLVGIDTPELGECGYERATDRLANLVEGQTVTLGESDEDRDQYGRLLRYVDRGSLDAGLEMIESGLAVARYDSRDGYGRHPREDRYIAADRSSPDVACAPAPQQFANAPSGCAPGYKPCVPVYPPDLDCADTGPVSVTGPDPHGLDADGDGLACGGD